MPGTGPGGQWNNDEEALVLRRDRAWLAEKMRQGYTIIDIGRQSGRSDDSVFYTAELEAIKDARYGKIVVAPRVAGTR